jgi:serine/threonine protein kinase/Tfp pilus assembly protein PilF
MSSNSGRVIEIFTEAIQLPVEERGAFVQRACADDEVLRRKVAALLTSNDRVSGFMEAPAPAVSDSRARVVAGEKPGDHVDRYRLLQQIGEGGCGVVFLAEQQAPVVRRVALKVVKPGMDTKSVIARFEAERQALALMDHPHIAHVFDAGATEGGRPYFVMELVEGVKITDYCDRHSLPTSARLELFTQVCDAIQHAHQKGIIHRDIKPSNILVVTGPDGKPVPKVIDFGIAKATNDQPLTDHTLFTSLGMLIGTPAYMSPEQATLASAELDTRTDIYSLGVLLYELLTSTTPFDTRELLRAGVDEIRRVIREAEPVRPSTRLSTMVAADLVNFSKRHGAEAPRLIREMRGDLDWIVMKALEKDRARRYATANGLAMDVERYLWGEAVLARPPSTAYKLQKLFLRNRLLFGSLSAVAAVLVIGFIVVTVALTREQIARRETDQARQEAVADKLKSEEVKRFLEDMLEGAAPSLALTRDTRVFRLILDRAAKRLAVELTNQPAVRAELQALLGTVYADIGQKAQAEALLRDALATRIKLFGEESETASDVMFKLGQVLDLGTKADEAETFTRRALQARQNLFGEEHLKVAECYTVLGTIFWRRQQLGEARELLEKSLALHRRLLDNDSPWLGDVRLGLGSINYAQGKYPEAEELFRQAMNNWEKVLSQDHPSVIQSLNNLAVVLSAQGKDADAEPLIRRAVETRRKLHGEAHPSVVNALHSLTRMLIRLNRSAEAEVTGREALMAARKTWGDTKEDTLEVLRDLINALLAQHKYPEADQLFADMLPPEHASKPEYAGLLYERCDTYARCRRWRDAVADAKVLLNQSPDNHDNYHLLAPLLVQHGNLAEYQRLCRTILDKFSGTTDMFVADRMAKDCLILSSSGVDLTAVAAMADVAVSRGSNAAAAPYFQFCKSLAEFRLGQYEEALKWAHLATASPLLHPKAGGYSVIAMSQFKLNQLAEARVAFHESQKIVENQMPKPEKELGRDWRDWIIVHALRSEAEQMIEGESGATPQAISSP